MTPKERGDWKCPGCGDYIAITEAVCPTISCQSRRPELITEREQWKAWMLLALAVIDAYVPVRNVPDELDYARRACEGKS